MAATAEAGCWCSARSGPTEHCEFSPAEVGRAWDDLVTWVRHDRKPAGDRLDPKSVAAPDYGCRFSDRAAYTTGTRRLFPACP